MADPEIDAEIQRLMSIGYLSRLFHGAVELKMEHILLIAREIGLHPAEFFHLAYPQPPARPSEASARLRAALEGFRPAPPAAVAGEAPAARPSQEEIERMMMASLRKLLSELGREPG
jgi:hypothetical protein